MKRIFVLTGAGISAPSGIQTFRGSDGLWNGYRVEEVATPEAFDANPSMVYDFYNARRSGLFEVQPNAAHRAIARLAKSADVTVVTQNVDDLHERGGASSVVHMHGELRKVRCLDCGEVVLWDTDLTSSDCCPRCQGRMRPDIVWFGEIPYGLDQIEAELRRCDLFLCIGTSGNVYPANDFVRFAKRHGAYAIEFNLESTMISDSFDECVTGDVVETVPEWVSQAESRL